MADKGVCRECGIEVKLTPKNQMASKHDAPRASATFNALVCKGSGKDPILVRPCVCDTCSTETLYRADGRMARHRGDDGAWCEMEMGEAAMELKTQLGATEVTNSQHPDPKAPVSANTNSSSPSSTTNSAPSSDGPSSTPTAVCASAPVAASSSSMPIQYPVSNSGSVAPPQTQPSTGSTAPTMESPPSSADMFGSSSTPIRAPRRKRQVLEGRAAELASQMKEVWWASQSRSERTLQTSIGPSEIGLDCMRRLAMKMSGMQQVNHDGDPWAAWVGTAMHSAYEVMFTEASGTSGRWMTETRVEIGSTVVPKGTADLFDRHLHRVIDHKNQGKSSLSKSWLDGPSQQYQTQLQVYGLGLERMGEDVREVAMVAWPREGNSLDELYAWVADYDRDLALAAIGKVESIAKRLLELGDGGWRKAPKSPSFGCRFCPFYLPGDKDEDSGCSA